MGLWNFVKKAGKAIGIGEAEAAEAAPEPDALKTEQKEKVILATGNVRGVAKVEEEIKAEKDAAEPVFHTVEKGDTLWAISEKTLGKGARYMEIFEANKPMLKDPDKIYPGQMLRIPK